MTLQLRCIKVCQSVRIFPLQHYIMQKDAGRGSCRKNDFSSEFSGCLVCPLHYSYVGWSLITCQAATALNQLFYWPRALSSVSLGLSSALSVFCLPSLCPGVISLLRNVLYSALHHSVAPATPQTTDKTRTANITEISVERERDEKKSDSPDSPWCSGLVWRWRWEQE